MNRAEMVVMLHRVDQGLVYGEDCGTDVEGGGGVSLPTLMGINALSASSLEVEFNIPLDADTAEDASHYTVSGPGNLSVDSATLTIAASWIT